jgi:hypothetical protein
MGASFLAVERDEKNSEGGAVAGRNIASIQRQLTICYRNLDELEERRAKFGINAPIDLINQIHDLRDEIAQLEAVLAGHDKPEALSPESASTVDARRQQAAIETLSERDWDSLLRRIKDGNCTPFIGPEVCQDVIPRGSDIARAWAEEHVYPLSDADNLPRVAQFLATSRDPAFPAESLAGYLQGLEARPNFRDGNEPHSFLASLPLPIYITTNYDEFMVQALKYRLRQPTQEVCRWNDYVRDIPSAFDPGANVEVSPANPVVFHLFGHTNVPEAMVLTEDDYLDFLVRVSRRPEIIPSPIQKALVKSSLLFIGYQLHDFRFRVLFRGLIASLERSLRRTRVAVQIAPEPAALDSITEDHVRWYLEDYFAKDDVRVYWGNSFDFISELRQRWEDFIGHDA